MFELILPNCSKELKAGVVGLGKMGLMHSCILNVLPNVRLLAICDKSWLMRKIVKQMFSGCLLTDNLGKFTDLDLDMIYILTPIPSHHNIIKDIYTQNIARNLFVEKTLASNFTQSKDLFELSQKRGGVNMVGYMKRFGVTFNRAKQLLDKHALGKLSFFDSYAFSSDFADLPEGSTISRARGGAIEDLGSHVGDLALWFFGELDVTSAKIESHIAQGSEDKASFEVKGSSGLTGRFRVSWCENGYRMPEFGLTIKGEYGELYVNDDELELKLNEDKPERWYRQDMGDDVGFFLGGSEYFREDEYFAQHIASGCKTESDFESAMRV